MAAWVSLHASRSFAGLAAARQIWLSALHTQYTSTSYQIFADGELRDGVEGAVLDLLSQQPWERKLGGLMGAKVRIPNQHISGSMVMLWIVDMLPAMARGGHCRVPGVFSSTARYRNPDRRTPENSGTQRRTSATHAHGPPLSSLPSLTFALRVSFPYSAAPAPAGLCGAGPSR